MTSPRWIFTASLLAALALASGESAAASRTKAAAPAKTSSLARAGATRPAARPLTLDAQHIVGRDDGPRVFFVHAEPTLALELAPARPSYLRDDFSAALVSPVLVRVRDGATIAVTPGGSR